MKKSAPILAAGMDLDAGDGAARVGDRARRQRNPRLPERVRHAVGEQRLHPGPAGEDLERADAAGRGIAVARRGDVGRRPP